MTAPYIFIDGDQGTTGLQIHDRLRERSDLVMHTLPCDQRKDTRSRAEALNSCDIAILCLPDQAAREAVSLLKNPAVRIIDASSAHRVEPGWTYGFPEMDTHQVEKIRHSKRVSNPGCYPTGAIGLLRPLVQAGLLPNDYPLSIHAISGYSGGGRAAVNAYENAADAAKPSLSLYGLGLAHKHVPEIQNHAGLGIAPVFIPAYGSFRQGIVLSLALQQRLLPCGADGPALHACLTEHYAHSDHVRVLPFSASSTLDHLDPQQLNGTNDMELAVFWNPKSGQILLTAILDNLGKGAAGAAVQNLNLMLQSH